MIFFILIVSFLAYILDLVSKPIILRTAIRRKKDLNAYPHSKLCLLCKKERRSFLPN